MLRGIPCCERYHGMLATGLQGVRNYKNVDNPVLLDVARGTSDDKIVFIMVGLPARGKTHTARRLARCVRRRLRPAAARVSHAGRGVAHGNVSVRRGIYPTPTRLQFQYAMRRGQPFYAATRDRGEPGEPSVRTGTSRSCTRCRSRSSTSGTSAGACSGSSRRPSSSGPPRTHARTRTRAHTRTQRHDRTRPCRGHPTTATLVYGSISHQRCVTNHAAT